MRNKELGWYGGIIKTKVGRADEFQERLNKPAISSMETKSTVKPKAEREKQKQFGSMVVVVRTMGRVENGEVGEIIEQVSSTIEVLEVLWDEEDFKELEGIHSFNTTKYGLEALITMRALISRNGSWEEKKSKTKVEALAYSGSSVSIISFDLAQKIHLQMRGQGSASLKDASGDNMDVSGRGRLVIQEAHSVPHKIKVRLP